VGKKKKKKKENQKGRPSEIDERATREEARAWEDHVRPRRGRGKEEKNIEITKIASSALLRHEEGGFPPPAGKEGGRRPHPLSSLSSRSTAGERREGGSILVPILLFPPLFREKRERKSTALRRLREKGKGKEKKKKKAGFPFFRSPEEGGEKKRAPTPGHRKKARLTAGRPLRR